MITGWSTSAHITGDRPGSTLPRQWAEAEPLTEQGSRWLDKLLHYSESLSLPTVSTYWYYHHALLCLRISDPSVCQFDIPSIYVMRKLWLLYYAYPNKINRYSKCILISVLIISVAYIYYYSNHKYYKMTCWYSFGSWCTHIAHAHSFFSLNHRLNNKSLLCL